MSRDGILNAHSIQFNIYSTTYVGLCTLYVLCVFDYVHSGQVLKFLPIFTDSQFPFTILGRYRPVIIMKLRLCVIRPKLLNTQCVEREHTASYYLHVLGREMYVHVHVRTCKYVFRVCYGL